MTSINDSGSSSLPPLSPKSSHRLDKSFSGGSTCSSQGYGPSCAAGNGSGSLSTSATNLTVPDTMPGGGQKVSRSTSPLSFTARLRRRKEKKLQKQEHLGDDMNYLTCGPSSTEDLAASPGSLAPTSSSSSSTTSKLKQFRKKSWENNPFALSFRKGGSNSAAKDLPPCPNSLSPRSAGESFPFDQCLSPRAGMSPEGRSPRTPTSPGGGLLSAQSSSQGSQQCKCRRCSLLPPLDDCEPKEMSALFKFLRKSKVRPWALSE